MIATEAQLDELVSRVSATRGAEKDAELVTAIVAELRARRQTGRNEARRDAMMMAAAVASELMPHYEHGRPDQRADIAQLAVSMAFEIEKATPK